MKGRKKGRDSYGDGWESIKQMRWEMLVWTERPWGSWRNNCRTLMNCQSLFQSISVTFKMQTRLDHLWILFLPKRKQVKVTDSLQLSVNTSCCMRPDVCVCVCGSVMVKAARYMRINVADRFVSPLRDVIIHSELPLHTQIILLSKFWSFSHYEGRS